MMNSSGQLIHGASVLSDLPIGAFPVRGSGPLSSQGRSVTRSSRRWCDGVMRFSLTTLDCHYAIRAYRAGSVSTFRDVNAECSRLARHVSCFRGPAWCGV